MFYKEDEISEDLKCPYCKNKYDDPRIIECESSFCMSCIEFLTKNNSNGFQCPVCNEFHEQPKKGYLKNTNLAKLCKKKANKVYRSPLADALEIQLDELKQNINKLAKENDQGEDKIKEYCNDLRNEVQRHLRELTESLKNQSLDLIHTIDVYEYEAMRKFDANHNLRLDAFLNETRQFHEKWAEYFKQFKIDNEEVKLASHETKKLQNKLKKESELFLSKVFRFNLLKFKKSTPLFGCLVNVGVKQSYFKALNSLKAYDFSAKEDHAIIKKVSFKLLSNGDLCMAFRQNNETIVRMAIFDNQLETRPLMHHAYQEFQLVELNEALVLCLFDPGANANNISPSRIIKYDNNLNFLGEAELGFGINYADVREDKLYLLGTSSDQNSKHIYVYDESFKLLEKYTTQK